MKDIKKRIELTFFNLRNPKTCCIFATQNKRGQRGCTSSKPAQNKKKQNNMNPIKVKELYESLGKAIKEGHGDKFVYLSSDDEGNDYHGLYCEPMTDPEDVRQYMQYSCSGLRNCPEPEKAIIL